MADFPPPPGSLRRQLSSFGVLLLTLSCLSPVLSVFGTGGDVLRQAGTGAAGLFALAVAAAAVWGLVYAELGSAFPYAGGDYVGVGAILGDWAGVVTLALWAATDGPQNAFIAKTLAVYLGQVLPGLPVAGIPFLAVGAAMCVALLAVRVGALVTGLFLAVETAAIVALIAAGLAHPVRGLGAMIVHPVALGHGGFAPISFAALALAGVSAVYATVGGNQAIAFGEELRDPHRRMGRVILIACLIGAVATAAPVIFVVLGARDLAAILRSPAPFAAFLSQALGPWAGPALGAGVAVALFNALIVGLMFNARLLFSIGRDGLLGAGFNRLLAGVHGPSGAPRAATLAAGAITAACCLLNAHVLLVFITGMLVYAWPLVCLAVLVGRRRGLTGRPGYWRSPLFPLAPVLGLAMAAAFALADLADADAGRPSLVLLGLLVVGALLWNHLRRRAPAATPRRSDDGEAERP